MANRYIRHGAAFNGDGTTSALAASNGGVGAWNDITIFEGVTPAYGTLPAGTTVFIRSKDEAGNDITVAFAAAKTLGAGAGVGTELLPVKWVIDDGAVWPGITGVVTYNATDNAPITLRDYNNFLAKNHSLILKNSYVWMPHGTNAFVINKCNTQSVKFDASISGISGSWGPSLRIYGGTHVDPWIIWYGSYGVFIVIDASCEPVFYGPKIELLKAGNDGRYPLFGVNYGSGVRIYGGSCSGAGANVNTPLIGFSSYTKNLNAFGFVYPSTMPLSLTSINEGSYAAVNGADGRVGNAYMDNFCIIDSRDDGYYPTLNASLETSGAEGWSYKIYPYRVGAVNPAQVSTSKIYTQTDAVQTVTLELLWPTSMAAPDSATCYMVLQYTDAATGNKVVQSTFDALGASLAVSGADWDGAKAGAQMSYGPTLFDKKKMALTTNGAIKQDYEVLVSLFVAARSATTNDILFVCPDPTFS